MKTHREESTHTLTSDHVRNLDDRILLRLWEDTLTTRALNIKTEYTEGRRLRPLSVGRMRNEVVPLHA